MKIFNLLFCLTLSSIIIVGCRQDQPENVGIYTAYEYETLSKKLNLPGMPYPYGFGDFSTGIEQNNKGTLGRVLFYDKALSLDGEVSCASCHDQSIAFSDNIDFSHGPNGRVTGRNSIALASVASFGSHYGGGSSRLGKPGLFWDERVGTVEEQIRETMANPDEMGVSLQEVIDHMNSLDHYKILHKKAFKKSHISERDVLESLAAFVNSIHASDSKFDKANNGSSFIFAHSNLKNFSAIEDLGFDLFIDNCASCHGFSINFITGNSNEPLESVANNGLDKSYTDVGVFGHSDDFSDVGKFKIPGLRNIELTGPYMHDGRFETLEEVIDFYSDGIQNHPNLHEDLKEGDAAKKMNFTSTEKAALVAFLKTLTDEETVSNEKWSDPFLR